MDFASRKGFLSECQLCLLICISLCGHKVSKFLGQHFSPLSKGKLPQEKSCLFWSALRAIRERQPAARLQFEDHNDLERNNGGPEAQCSSSEHRYLGIKTIMSEVMK
ncbi:unnamed protein product [Acanthoscelides obtectus]|uniref:Uncharacterized protein n=1 Tax=Acanthoscelides obtectus TaxID=200917 RepID=A0A9P0PJF7_ACAOB|nr:unnamed protein product [Acanthoscelides obtectus]CAK1638538.1 hypothetical protein AOBTE_LOCUS10654 [Acanthoscelides obtectus]